MEEKNKNLMQQGLELFTRILMKYDAIKKNSIDLGGGDKLTASHIHIIEAVGKEYGKTVTALSIYFMITKGAVSQVVSRLCKDGYMLKTKKKGNEKEIILELTKKGWKAFEYHEKLNESAMGELMQIRNKYSEAELQSFLNVLNDMDVFFGKSIVKEKRK